MSCPPGRSRQAACVRRPAKAGSGLATCALTLCVACNPAHARGTDTDVTADHAIATLRGVAKHDDDKERRTAQDLTPDYEAKMATPTDHQCCVIAAARAARIVASHSGRTARVSKVRTTADSDIPYSSQAVCQSNA